LGVEIGTISIYRFLTETTRRIEPRSALNTRRRRRIPIPFQTILHLSNQKVTSLLSESGIGIGLESITWITYFTNIPYCRRLAILDDSAT
jgi:hypothetical protein